MLQTIINVMFVTFFEKFTENCLFTITNWKRELVEGAAELFDKGQKTKKQHDNTVDEVRNRFLPK